MTEIFRHNGGVVCESAGMRTHSRKLWPLWLVDAVLAAVALFVLSGTAAGVVSFVAMLAFIGTGVYGLAGQDVNDGAVGIGGGAGF